MSLVAISLTILGLIVAALIALVGYSVFTTRRIVANAEKAAPPRGTYIEIEGNRIHYVEQGEGRPILFVHGLGAQLNHFRAPIFPLLSGYRLVALDRPGSGYSTRVRGGKATLTEQARLVAKFIDALKLDRPLLVGHSLGGAVSLMTALNHPDKVAGLALVAPLTAHRDDIPPQFQALAIRSDLKRWLLSQTLAVPKSLQYAEQTLTFVFGPQKWPDDYGTEGGGWSGLRPSHIYASGTDFVALEHEMPAIEKRYGELKMPVGILFGTADRVLEYDRHGLAMRDKVKGLELELLDGIGHMPQFVAAEKTAAFIKRMAAKSFA
ncbi:MAG TPA: alpha/beta fold hydrolase [Rhizobiaceae bacterium]|nr:alpha/beta fold hydrolase [Rhizobiaceae bacterium]